MTKSTKTMELKLERTISAPPGDVFDAWMNPKVPGTPWNASDRLIWEVKVDGLFYLLGHHGTPHYGRFTAVERPGRIQHTWMSPYTSGEESTVTVTFERKGQDTLMTLVHSDLPDADAGKAHEEGWTSLLGSFREQVGARR